MYKDNKITVVVPAYNEEKLIGRVIETMPDFVDEIVIVDDKSRDKTVDVVESYISQAYRNIILIKNKANEGVGGAIARGYKKAIETKADITAVMAGDAQMDPEDLPNILDPIVEKKAHYTKGNRLFTGEAYRIIPRIRYFGNAVLSLLTKIASGYWHIADSQSGYTAICRQALECIDWDKMYKHYGQPNDVLVRLNVYNFKVEDVPIKPVYNIGERSGIRIYKVLFSISWLLTKLFFWRLKQKYIIRNFHPLVFFYLMGFILLSINAFLCFRAVYLKVALGFFPSNTFLAWIFSFSMGFQFLLFAMWFDMEQVNSHSTLIQSSHEAPANEKIGIK